MNKIRKIKEKSINRILNNETAGPIIIDAGMKENNVRKYELRILLFILINIMFYTVVKE
ncbi:hypothetical protein OAM28_02195 [Candidatus Pelagibacter sp.]|nr:hypothetical protein [Candidatus Pelagibacter sp.]MDC0404900.1 hypothetical protein [Candidatus Pelagibacter sp.]